MHSSPTSKLGYLSFKKGEVFLQCISIAFVPKFTYEALCSDCERLATFYVVVVLDSQR